MPILAEDSGIEIDALNGYPGVYTKRCIEKFRPGANVNEDKPEELYPIILEIMKESGNTSTTAHWISAMAFIDSERTICEEESLDGNMCSCSGERKFGFDQYLSHMVLVKHFLSLLLLKRMKLVQEKKYSRKY